MDHYTYSHNDPALGTTIFACEFDGGVLLGADSRTSSGPFVANRVSDKITEVHDKIYVCRSGSAADTQAVTEVLRMYLALHAMEQENPPEVSVASSVLNKICTENKQNLLAGMIIAGYDKRKGGQVFCIPVGGGQFQEKWAIGGSGSGYIYGFCDASWRDNMSRAEAVDFAKRAISLAMSRDGSSGGHHRCCWCRETNDIWGRSPVPVKFKNFLRQPKEA